MLSSIVPRTRCQGLMQEVLSQVWTVLLDNEKPLGEILKDLWVSEEELKMWGVLDRAPEEYRIVQPTPEDAA